MLSIDLAYSECQSNFYSLYCGFCPKFFYTFTKY
ncbi:hypothetical protein CJA_0811 [Cellvibrio japonicus Ueda107]|uniref:Uncharacterized protein n=1 Tax=Cellvibrio japonicus (strain Ueda107) TaxID=498211 RepID=B3PKQ4_CELJU|nr:hypothetical protein CJA_0811 [Cellvibrio japonicus Ueda107]